MAYQTINPATGTLVREFATITDDELDTVVSHAHEAFRMDWRQRPVPDRASIVAGAAQRLRVNAEEYGRWQGFVLRVHTGAFAPWREGCS